MAAIFGDSVAVVRTRPRAIPLAMITMGKSIHGFPFLSYMGMGLRYKSWVILPRFQIEVYFKIFDLTIPYKICPHLNQAGPSFSNSG